MTLVCEDLVTKAEFEELKEQINTLLGKSEDGSQTIDVLKAGTLEGTATGGLLLLAGTAIQKIIITGDTGGNIAQALASGAAKFEAIKGKGAKVLLDGFNNLGKTVGKNVAKAKILASGVAGNAQAISIGLNAVAQGASVGIQIGTLNLIKQNTANNEFAFNALSRDYVTMMGFISKHQSSIAEAEAANEHNKQVIQEQRTVIIQQVGNIASQQTTIAQLKENDRVQKEEIEKANTVITSYKAEVEAFQDDVDDFKQDMETHVIELESALLRSESVNDLQTQSIEQLELENQVQNDKLGLIEKQLISIDLTNILWRQEFINLRDDLLGDPELKEAKSKLLEAKTILAQKKIENNAVGGGTATAVGAATKAQNGIIDLAEQLVGVPTIAPDLTNDDTYNNTGAFTNTLANLLTQIQNPDAVNEEQLTNLREGIKLDIQDVVPAVLGLTVIPGINQIKSQTTPSAISSATATGVCSTTAPGGCMNTNLKQPLQDQMGQMINNAGTAFSAANNALLQTMNGTLNGIKNTTNTIKATTNTTLGIVSHATHGLEAIQNYAAKAWKATRVGKILEYLSVVATIHNAAMLSRNLGGSLGDTASAIANNTISLIKNEEFQGIDINQTLGTSIEGFLKGLIGEANYTGASETLSKYNRIVNSASNVIYSVTSIQAGLAQGLETVGNYTGRIGNALKKSGAVLESSYGWMSEKVSVKTGRLGQIQSIINTGEGIENLASDIQNATEEFREAQENVNNIKNQYEKVQQEFTDQETEKTELENTTKTNSQGAQPVLTDFVRDPLEN